LPHDVPSWIDPSQELYFITINCLSRGPNQLCLPERGEALLESACFRHAQAHWFIHLFLLMPDHLHAILSFPKAGPGIQRTVSSWKGWTAKQCRIEWQRDFFEHRLRNDESASQKWDYIRRNPVRVGLVKEPVEWPWSLRMDHQSGELLYDSKARTREARTREAARPYQESP